MDNLIFHIMVCNSLWGVVITPKKGMSTSNIWVTTCLPIQLTKRCRKVPNLRLTRPYQQFFGHFWSLLLFFLGGGFIVWFRKKRNLIYFRKMCTFYKKGSPLPHFFPLGLTWSKGWGGGPISELKNAENVPISPHECQIAKIRSL